MNNAMDSAGALGYTEYGETIPAQDVEMATLCAVENPWMIASVAGGFVIGRESVVTALVFDEVLACKLT